MEAYTYETESGEAMDANKIIADKEYMKPITMWNLILLHIYLTIHTHN